jgi:hypothetical protein
MSFGARFEGDRLEVVAFLDAVQAMGYAVRLGTVKKRQEGFFHVYCEISPPGGGTAPPEPGPRRPTTRTAVVQGRALPAGRRSRGY